MPIFDHFIRAFDGDVDIDGFWMHMVNWHTRSGTMKMSGWLGYLVPFTKEGRWALSCRTPRIHDSASESEDDLSDAEESVQKFWTNWCRNGDKVWSSKRELRDIASGGIAVQLKVDDNGYVFDGTLMAGVLGWEWHKKLETISLYVGWVLSRE